KPALGVIGVLFLVTPCMVADMSRGPLERRVFQRPSASDQQSRLDPPRAVEASVGDETMVADRDAQTSDDIQEPEHGPIHPRVVMEIREHGKPDQGAQGDEAEKDDRPITALASQRLDRVYSRGHNDGLLVWVKRTVRQQAGKRLQQD